MAVIFEDLAQHGVVLIPPSAPKYFELRREIAHRLQNRLEGSPPVEPDVMTFVAGDNSKASAVLINEAKAAIVSIAHIWWVVGRNKKIVPHSFLPGTNSSAVLPFWWDERAEKFSRYWHSIFPGSARLFVYGGKFGDNTDVRPPVSDELSRGGGFVSWGGGMPKPVKATKLELDGVFFADGTFAGPNRLGSWEETIFSAEAHLACAALARDAAQDGKSAEEFFRELPSVTGQEEGAPMPPPGPPSAWLYSPPLDPEPIRKRKFQMLGWEIFFQRKHFGDEVMFDRIQKWADAPIPQFRRV